MQQERAIEIMVSDPWEFGSEHGVGPFRAGLYRVTPNAAYACLLEPIVICGVPCRFVKISPRLSNDSIDSLLNGKLLGANFVFGEDDASLSEPWNSAKAPFGGIGSVEIV